MAIVKVFKIELAGGKAVNKDLSNIKRTMNDMGKTISSTKSELDLLLNVKGDSTQIAELSKRLADLNKSYETLKKQKQTAETDQKRQIQLEKALADQKVKAAQAEKLQAQTTRERIKSQIDQEKELDRQIALEQKLEKELRKQKAIADALPGSYLQVKAALAQLRPFIQTGGAGGLLTFNGQQINFDEAIAEYKKLSAAEQDFRRQFARDGLLVGEYSSGIVQAFRSLNIDDIIKNQVQGGKQALNDLEAKTNDLVVAYRKAQSQGTADLNKLEKEIHDNVTETQRLKTAIGQAEIQLKGMGGVGSQITGAINKNFKDLKNSVGQFVVGFFGFQAVLNGVQRGFADTVRLDSLDAALSTVSRSTEELAKNEEFLARSTDFLGLEVLSATSAFKGFYAASTQAGISADETREIFYNAATAGSSLKLSTEDMNGVLLAFSQVASKGKVQAEELRGQIGERIPGAFSIAARSIGVTEQKLNKMMENGEVIASEFLPKFARELVKTFPPEGNKRVEGLQASVNRLRNEFTQLLKDNQKGLSTFFSFAIEGAGLLIKYLPIVVGLLALYTAEQVRAYFATQLTTKGTILYNAALLLQTIRTKAVTLFTKAATFQIVLFNGAIKLSPLGWFLGILAAVVPAMALFAESVAASAKEIDAQAVAQRKLNQQLADIGGEVAQGIAQTRAQIDSLIAVLKNESIAIETRKIAYAELIKIAPEFNGFLKDEKINIDGLISTYEVYIKRLDDVARAKAFQSLNEENVKNQLLAEHNLLKATIKLQEEQDRQKKEPVTGRDAEDRGLQQFSNIANITELRADVNKKARELQEANALVDQTTKFRTDLITKLQKSIDEDKVKLGKLDKTSTEAKNLAIKIDSEESQLLALIGVSKASSPSGGSVTIESLKGQLAEVDKQIAAIVRIKNKSDKQVDQLKALRKQRLEVVRQIKELGGTVGGGRASRLTADQKDLFKTIEADRDEQLATNKQKFLQLIIDEKAYLKNELAINTKANNDKLKVLKGFGAEEKRVRAELNLQKISDQQETNRKLFTLINKERESALNEAVRQQEQLLEQVDADPSIAETEKVKLKQQILDQLLLMQIGFNQKQIQLEKSLGIISQQEAENRAKNIAEVTKRSFENEKGSPQAILKDIETEGDIAIARIKQDIAQRVAVILASNESYSKKARDIDALQKEETQRLLQAEVDALKKSEAEASKLLEKKLISQQQYQDILTDLKIKEASLIQLTTDKEVAATNRFIKALQGLKDQFVETFLGIKKYSNDAAGEQERVTDAIQTAYRSVQQAITEAYEGYFENERSRIDAEKQSQQESLDREKERVLARAESEAEKETIERQFELKRKALDKKAAEEKRKLALKQLTIDFAVALVKTFAQFGFPLGLIPAAGLTLLYGVQRGLVNSQKFAAGGKVRSVKNGKISGPSNIPAQSNGDNVLETVRVGEVVLNEIQQRKLGGPSVFRRIGVPGFNTGGLVRAPQMGTSLRPPTFTQGYYSSGNSGNSNDGSIDELKKMVADIADVVLASDQKEVILSDKKVSKAQTRRRRDVQVGTI